MAYTFKQNCSLNELVRIGILQKVITAA